MLDFHKENKADVTIATMQFRGKKPVVLVVITDG